MSNHPQPAPALSESEIRFRTLFDSAAEFIFVIDAEGYIVLTNRYVSDQSGYQPDELAGRHIKELFTDASRKLCDCNFPTLRSEGHTRAEVEFVCRDGRVLQMECLATAIPDRQGLFTSFLIIQRDITERKRAAEELANSERKFRAIFNSTLQFIGLLDPQGTLIDANKAALEAVGSNLGEVIGKPFWETPWWSGLDEEQCRLKEAVSRAARGELVRYETRHTGANGETCYVDFSLKPVLNDKGETVLIIPEGRDITKRRLAEESALQHQRESAHLMRLTTMGEMAASMAHEINQPLTALISYCGTVFSQLQDNPTVPGEHLAMLRRANQQAHRASDIVQHICSFVSKGDLRKTDVDIDSLIVDMSRLLDWDLRDTGIDIHFDLDARKRCIHGNSVQIEQVLLNLIRNSIEAIHNAGMPGGRIDLRTRIDDNRSVVITVTDNGPGIAPEMVPRLFEPFQTSKESGMGMGLSICRSIVNSHKGKIWLADPQPRSTSFCVRLPSLD